MAHATHAGRNDPCPCGSGKKYKRCCAGKAEGGASNKVMMFVVFGLIAGALLFGLAQIGQDHDGGAQAPGRVWSAEHGHWH